MTTEWVDTLPAAETYWDVSSITHGAEAISFPNNTIRVATSSSVAEIILSVSNSSELLVGREVLGVRLNVSFEWVGDPGSHSFQGTGIGSTSFIFGVPSGLSFDEEVDPSVMVSASGDVSFDFTLGYWNNPAPSASITITKLDLLLTSLDAQRFWTGFNKTREVDL